MNCPGEERDAGLKPEIVSNGRMITPLFIPFSVLNHDRYARRGDVDANRAV
jgi:hypothetical protein